MNTRRLCSRALPLCLFICLSATEYPANASAKTGIAETAGIFACLAAFAFASLFTAFFTPFSAAIHAAFTTSLTATSAAFCLALSYNSAGASVVSVFCKVSSFSGFIIKTTAHTIFPHFILFCGHPHTFSICAGLKYGASMLRFGNILCGCILQKKKTH